MTEVRLHPLLCGDPFDPVMQLLAEDLAALGTPPEINVDPDPTRHDRILHCDQASFLAGLFVSPLDQIPVTVVLRRPGPMIGDDGWASGIGVIGRMVERLGRRAIQPTTLTPEAAAAVARAGCPTAVPLALAADAGTDVASDRRLWAEFDTDNGTILTSRGLMQADAQNWAQLRRRLRFKTDSCPQNDIWDLLTRCNSGAPAMQLPTTFGAAEGPTYVAVVTNGVGLGHLTRLLAIADALRAQAKARVVFWCFSQGAGILVGAGYEVVQRMTAQHLDCDYDDWIDWEEAAFSAFLAKCRPAAVLYDSSGVDRFVTAALRRPSNGSTALVLVRRAMWQSHRDPAYLDAAQHTVLVAEPGDLSAAADRGPTVTASPRLAGFARFARTAPVVLRPDGGSLPRAAARRALGVSPFQRRVCLVSLGGEAFGRDATLARDISASASKAGIELIWARSPLARSAADLGIDRALLRHLFPLGRYLMAFDGVITACGYNSFHEAMQTLLPVLLAPTANERLDDQVARASHAKSEGWAMMLDPGRPEDRAGLLDHFMGKVRAGQQVLRPATAMEGAAEMAQLILEETFRGKA
ncbi:MAG: hypothetical protein ABI832_13475 [bacterium]